MTKACRKCGEVKDLSLFRRNGVGSHICRACNVQSAREWKIANADKVRSYAQSYYSSHDSAAFETRRCVTCDKEFRFFTPRSYAVPNAGKYCSHECRKRSVTNICLRCHQPFQVWPCLATKRKYCSLPCAWGVWPKAQITCARCGKLSPPLVSSLVGQRKFCSVQCSDAAHVKRHADVAVRYTGTAWRMTRRHVLARDEHRCTQCHSSFDLQVHHIVPWVETQDDSMDNLVTLCRTCHGSHHYPTAALVARHPRAHKSAGRLF